MSSSPTCFYIKFQESQATWIDPVSKQNENQFCFICKSKLSGLYNVPVNVFGFAGHTVSFAIFASAVVAQSSHEQ